MSDRIIWVPSCGCCPNKATATKYGVKYSGEITVLCALTGEKLLGQQKSPPDSCPLAKEEEWAKKILDEATETVRKNEAAIYIDTFIEVDQ